MPKVDPSLSNCLNCNIPLVDDAKYCHKCSQLRSDGKVPLFGFLKETVYSIFDLDGRFYKSIFHLFIPGRLSKNYFAGKRRTYLHPGRMFITCALIFLAAISVKVLTENRISGDYKKYLENKAQTKIYFELDSLSKISALAPVIDSLRLKLKKQYERGENTNDTPLINVNGMKISFDDTIKITNTDLYTLTSDEVIEKYNIEGFTQVLQTKQMLKASQDPGGFLRFCIGNLIWMMVLFIPLVALIMKLLYVRRKHYFVEHLVFLFHYHAFVFLSVAILITFWNYLSLFISVPMIVGIFVYEYMAMKKYYNQGTFKTLIKMFLLNGGYTFVLSIVIGIFVLISFLIF
jgi:hypothetical protein